MHRIVLRTIVTDEHCNFHILLCQDALNLLPDPRFAIVGSKKHQNSTHNNSSLGSTAFRLDSSIAKERSAE